MHLHWIDWAILGMAVLALRILSMRTGHYMRSVADFLSANRSAGRYLLTIASQMGSIGVISIVASYEVLYSAGIAPNWWTNMHLPVMVVIALTGWVYYRFRETRAMTLAQFLETRYNRRFRVTAGALCWLSGILNFGIFPAVFARFFIYFCGLPQTFTIPGLPWEFSTFITVMIIDLVFAVTFVTLGGQISVMITDCAQGIFATLAFLIIAGAVVAHFSLGQMVEALQVASQPQASMLNPFQTSAVKDFNFWYYLIALFGAFYTYMSWQGSQGFYCSARSPHEQKMGNIIGTWRLIGQGVTISLLGLAALVVLRLPEFSAQAAQVQQSLDTITNSTIQNQMRIPLALVHVLPVGIKGLFLTIMVFLSFTCHDYYLHSWGTIFIQDVYLPLRRKAITMQEHIRLLRWSVVGMAVFALIFSMLYPPNQPIYMFFAITGTIWLGGSGAVIIGGLYWKRGTTAGAYCALVTGAVLGVTGLLLPIWWKQWFNQDFPVNGQWLWLIAMAVSSLLYVLVSVLTGRSEVYNMDRLLHRGAYADANAVTAPAPTSVWLKLVGVTHEFSRSDRVLAIAMVAWNAIHFTWFIVFTAINLFWPISDLAWARNFYVWTIVSLVLSVPCSIWFTVGGLIDMRALFRHLATAPRDHTDNGCVADADTQPRADEPTVTTPVQ